MIEKHGRKFASRAELRRYESQKRISIQPSESEMDEQIKLKHPPTYFPITVKYDGDSKDTTVDKPEDIKPNISFTVTNTRVGKPWGLTPK